MAYRHTSNKYFLLAFGLLNILGFTLLLCGLSFLAGLTISKWQFPAGCLLALLTNYYTARFFIGEKSNRFFIKSSGVIIGSLTGLLLFAGSIYDISYDGQWYHQEIVYWLQHGFNPVYQHLAPPSDEVLDNYRPIPHVSMPDKIPVNLKFLDINHFSKGAEIIETAIYQDTGRIETGKAMNGVLLLPVM